MRPPERTRVRVSPGAPALLAVFVWLSSPEVLGAVLLAVLLLLLLRRKTVKFETFGGTAIGSRKAKRGEKLTRPPVPEKEGCGFGGWYQDTACTKPWDFDNDKVEKSMMLYAKWL